MQQLFEAIDTDKSGELDRTDGSAVLRTGYRQASPPHAFSRLVGCLRVILSIMPKSDMTSNVMDAFRIQFTTRTSMTSLTARSGQVLLASSICDSFTCDSLTGHAHRHQNWSGQRLEPEHKPPYPEFQTQSSPTYNHTWAGTRSAPESNPPPAPHQ